MAASFVTAQGETVRDVTPHAIVLDTEEISFGDPLMATVMDSHGITVAELQHRGIATFETRGKMNGVVYSTNAIRNLRYTRYNELRQKTVGKLLDWYRAAQEQQRAHAGAAENKPAGGETAIAMMAEQGAMLLAQEQKKAAELAASRVARAEAEAAQEADAEALRQANAKKQAQILKDFEKRKADFERTVRRRREEAQRQRMARVVKKQEDFEANVADGKRKEAARLARDKEIMAKQKVRQEEMQARSLAFARKRAQKMATISQMWAEREAKADKVADEKEKLVLQKAAAVAARAEQKQAAVAKANRKKQREIQRRLRAKKAEDKAQEDKRDREFLEKIKTVNHRLDVFVADRAKQTAQRIENRAQELKARDERLEVLRIQREMAGASGLDKAQMKAVICAEAFERKKLQCLENAVENQMRYNAKMAYIEQQRRVQDARFQKMAQHTEAKAQRAQSVIDAKVKLRENSKEQSKLAVVERAKLSSKAKLPRGVGDVPPLDWMLNPLTFENQVAGRAAAAECRRRASDMFNFAPAGLPPRAASSLF